MSARGVERIRYFSRADRACDPELTCGAKQLFFNQTLPKIALFRTAGFVRMLISSFGLSGFFRLTASAHYNAIGILFYRWWNKFRYAFR
jgi:hypothetical protein